MDEGRGDGGRRRMRAPIKKYGKEVYVNLVSLTNRGERKIPDTCSYD